jgi:hypothetical protein
LAEPDIQFIEGMKTGSLKHRDRCVARYLGRSSRRSPPNYPCSKRASMGIKQHLMTVAGITPVQLESFAQCKRQRHNIAKHAKPCVISLVLRGQADVHGLDDFARKLPCARLVTRSRVSKTHRLAANARRSRVVSTRDCVVFSLVTIKPSLRDALTFSPLPVRSVRLGPSGLGVNTPTTRDAASEPILVQGVAYAGSRPLPEPMISAKLLTLVM